MFDDLLRHANRYANKNVLDSRKLLLELFYDLEQMQVKNPLVKALYNGVDSSALYETDDDGKFTGNIIQFYNWGKWEKDLSEAYKQWKEEFKQLYASTPELINTNEKYNLRWDQFKTKKLNDWHNLHSHYNANENTYYPATGQVEVVGNVTISKLDYTNSKYTALSGEEKDWINNWIDLKKHLDSQLGKGRHTKYYRLPQFRGDVIEKTRTALQHSEGQNAWEKGINKAKNASTSLLDSLVEQFVLTSEDADYGSDEFYKADEDYLNPEGNGIYGEKLQRLPLYGINKLDDQELLSRDLMYSTLMYAAMAYKYAALSEACYAAQLGEQVYSKLNTRLSKGFSNKYGADTTKFKDFVGYSFLGRFRRYSDKALYKRYNITKFGKLSINKIATFFSRLGSTVTVAGNLTSGIKDLYGKLNGILREAHVSDYVTGKSVMKALWWYMKNVPEHVINLGNPYANDPISQFKSYFNVSDTLDQEFKEFETQKWRVRKILDSVLYAPLTASGDIETVMYIAVAFDTKVRDTKTGSIFNLMDFFIQNHKNKTLHERFDYFTDENDLLKDLSTDKLDRYNAIMETINKLEDFYNTHKGKITLQDQAALLASFSPEAINYITEYNNRGIQDNKEVLRLAKLEREEIIYNTKDEAVGVEGLGRFINNRIAGVYNLQDRTAFQDTWFGTIVYAQKGWFTGSVAEAELSSPRFNTKTKAENEGAKYTLVTFLLDLLYGEENNRKDLLLGFMCIGAPGNLGKNSKELLLAAGYSPNQIANLTRNIDHILTILALKGVSALFLVLSRVLANAGKEVPDDEDTALLAWAKAFGVLHYYAKASELELASMYLPWLLVKQITTSSDASKFVGIVGMVKICQLLGQAPAALRNNIVNKYNTDIVYSIDENEVHKSVITREYAEKLGISLIGVQKDKEGNIKVVKEYKRYEKDTTLEDGTEVKKGDFVLDSNGRRILERIRPLYKQQYAKSDRYSTFYTDDPRYKYVGGENKVKRTFNKITPYFKHRDVFNDPIEAAENLEKWWFKN